MNLYKRRILILANFKPIYFNIGKGIFFIDASDVNVFAFHGRLNNCFLMHMHKDTCNVQQQRGHSQVHALHCVFSKRCVIIVGRLKNVFL